MNNLIITTRQSPVRLLVDYVATTILWTLFALFIFLFAIDLLTGYYWQSEARSRLQFYFFAGSGECRRVNRLGIVQ